MLRSDAQSLFSAQLWTAPRLTKCATTTWPASDGVTTRLSERRLKRFMARPAKPPQKDSPFNALLERKNQPVNQSNVETAKLLDSQTATGLAKSADPEYIKFTTRSEEH